MSKKVKEILVKDTPEVKVWQVYKRCYKLRNGSGFFKKVMRYLSIFQKKDELVFSLSEMEKRKGMNIRQLNKVTFTIKEGKFICWDMYQGRRVYKSEGSCINMFFTKTSIAKIGRIMKQYFPNWKITKTLKENIILMNPNSKELLEKDFYLVSNILVRGKTFKESLKKQFGFNGKKFTREVTTCIMENIYMQKKSLDFLRKNKGMFTYGEVDLDSMSKSLIPYLNKVPKEFLEFYGKEAFKKHITKYTGFNGHAWITTDCLKMFAELQRHNIVVTRPEGGMKELHDYLILKFREIKDKPVSFSKKKSSIETVEGMEVRLPIDTAELKAWGDYMHNCIYGYKDHILKGYAVMLGLFVDNVLTYNVSMTTSGYIREINSRFNKGVTPELESKIKEGLKDIKFS